MLPKDASAKTKLVSDWLHFSTQEGGNTTLCILSKRVKRRGPFFEREKRLTSEVKDLQVIARSDLVDSLS